MSVNHKRVARIMREALAVHGLCKNPTFSCHWEMVDRSALRKPLDAGVFLPFEFAPKDRGALPPVGTVEGKELPRHKVPGMGRYDIEKARFRLGIAETLER